MMKPGELMVISTNVYQWPDRRVSVVDEPATLEAGDIVIVIDDTMTREVRVLSRLGLGRVYRGYMVKA